MTRLLLARHGNTFNRGDTPVWVGARTDMPLVDFGRRQAHALAAAWRGSGYCVAGFYSSRLARARETAEIVVSNVEGGLAIQTCDDLLELDYGSWEGSSNADIAASGSSQDMERWNAEAIWPASAGWSPGPEKVEQSVRAFIGMVERRHRGQTVAAFTSNGVARFFAGLAINAPLPSDRKLATGAYSVLEVEVSSWRIERWNIAPLL